MNTALESELKASVSQSTLVRCNEPLAHHTTFRVGGAADLYVEPATENDLAAVLRFCHRHRLAWLVLGRGSNVLVRDAGVRGAVICLSGTAFTEVKVMGTKLTCGAGAKLKAVAIAARQHGLSDLEFLEGIPGSVGGGLRMNAGAMGSSVFAVVESVRSMDCNGDILERPASNLNASYRVCPTLKQEIALSAVFIGRPCPRETIEQTMNEFSQKRWKSQPAAASAGCIFKNPITIPAGKLIDELGLKGTRIGRALISLEHGNFIVNEGGATAAQILELIELIRKRALAARGIELETEVQIIGD